MLEGKIYDGVSDVEGKFPQEFKQYIQDENLLCHYSVDDDDCGIWLFRKERRLDGVDSAYLDFLNKLMMPEAPLSPNFMVQFWKVEELLSDHDFGWKRFILTTRDQPFLISGSYKKDAQISEGICRYRMRMVDKVTGDGVMGRVFWNKRMESTPNIVHYSDQEYPQRDMALHCNIKGSLAIPLSDSFGCLIGVLEMVTQASTAFPFQKRVIIELQEGSGPGYLDHCIDLCGQYDSVENSLHISLSEIEEVMEVVGESCDLVCSRTWIFCDRCGSLSISKRLVSKLGTSYVDCSGGEHICTLKKGEGVVGKTIMSSHNLVYCRDISQFNIIEYPLAHFARERRLSSSFAISLKSDLTGSQIYVLECFLDPSKVDEIGMAAKFVPILEEMRHNFRSIKVASGEEVGDDLSVLVIDARSPDKIVTLRNRELNHSIADGINNSEARVPYTLQFSIGESSTNETNDPMTRRELSFHDTLTEKTSAISASTVQSLVMDEGEIYDAVRDAKGEFSSKFKEYVRDEKLLCRNLGEYDVSWFFRKEQQPNVVNSTYPDLINTLTGLAESFRFQDEQCLVQFWQAQELTSVDDFGKTGFILTTCNQPFFISRSVSRKSIGEEICNYRMKMVDIITRYGEEGGIIGRVFWNNRMEYAPNIGYYSSEEYPNRNLALSCRIKSSLVMPLSDSSGRLVGVLEMVSQSNAGFYFHECAIIKLRESSSLRCFNHCTDLSGQPLHVAVSEIRGVMEVLSRNCHLIYAQTWMFCKRHESLSIGRSLNVELDASYGGYGQEDNFLDAEYFFTLKQGEGVVGKAATFAHNLVYCGDVSQFSITEYPLAHFARKCRLTSSFAISLRSDLTGSQIYVLEFFLDPLKVNGSDPMAMLVPIHEGMRQNFRTFKLASGEEIGESLSVRVIDGRYPDQFEILEVGGLDLSSPTGIDNIKACRPYVLPNSTGVSSTPVIDDPMTGTKPHPLPHSIGESSTEKSDDLMNGIGPYPIPDSNGEWSTPETVSSASTVQSKCWLTMNVIYGDNSFKFQLSSSSNFPELSQQVSKRLNLNDGTYDVKYLDEDNDLILITCDEDLREYISCSMKREKYTLMMQIEPK